MIILKTLLAITIGIAATNVNATVKYIYNGNGFDEFTGSAFNSSDSISGFFTLNNFLAPNLTKASLDASILFYQFTSGVNTIRKGDIAPGFGGDTFTVDTDANGEIILWDVAIQQSRVAPSGLGDVSKLIRTENTYRGFVEGGEIIDVSSRGVCVVVESDGCSIFNVSTGSITENPGNWEVTVIPVPPAGLLLFSALFWIGQRRAPVKGR